jgi:hypothetical protein
MEVQFVPHFKTSITVFEEEEEYLACGASKGLSSSRRWLFLVLRTKGYVEDDFYWLTLGPTFSALRALTS